MKMWCLSVYPQGIQDVGDFVSSVEHKQRFLTQTVAVCQSYNAVKKIHRQNQIKPWGSWRYIEVLRHETNGLCKKLNSIYIIFYLVLSVYVLFFLLSKPWVPLTAII